MRASYIFVAIYLVIGFLVTGAAHAGFVANNDLIKVLDTAGPRYGGGGPFTIDNVTDPSVPNFISFCLERNEYLNWNTEYRVELSPIAYMGGLSGQTVGGLGDPLDTKSAFLYSNFFHGTLNGLLSGWTASDLQEMPKSLQEVFWFIEGELPGTTYASLSGKAKKLYDLASSKTLNNGGSLYDVSVMNLYHPTTGAHQQSLLTTLPEPASVVMWAVFGVCGLMYARRRRKAAR